MRKLPLAGGAVVRAYLDELRATVKAVQATNDPAFGATGARLAEAVDSLDRATTWLLSKVEKEPDSGARRRHALSAAVRQRRRRLHAGRRGAGGAPHRRRRAGRARRHRALLRREHRGAGVRAWSAPSPKAPTASTPPTPRWLNDMSDHVIVTDEGPIRTVRMNRPDKKNALTAAMYDAMADALESASSHADIRCVRDRRRARRVLRRQRSRRVSRRRPTSGEGLAPPVIRFLHALARSERPLVAAVQGLAVGVGTTMLLHCDHVVAGDRCALLDAVRQPRPGAGGGVEPAGAAPDGPSRAPSRCW